MIQILILFIVMNLVMSQNSLVIEVSLCRL